MDWLKVIAESSITMFQVFFIYLQAVVRESRTEDDPDGEVRLMVERIQGSEGVVNVQWRLNAEAVYDFYEPHTGTMLFAQVKHA